MEMPILNFLEILSKLMEYDFPDSSTNRVELRNCSHPPKELPIL